MTLRGPPESLGMGRMEKTAPKDAAGCIIDTGQDGKTEILDEQRRIASRPHNGQHKPCLPYDSGPFHCTDPCPAELPKPLMVGMGVSFGLPTLYTDRQCPLDQRHGRAIPPVSLCC